MKKNIVLGYMRNLYGETYTNRCVAVTPCGEYLNSLVEVTVHFGDKIIPTGDYLLNMDKETSPVIFLQEDWIGSRFHGTKVLKIWDPRSRKGVCTKDFSKNKLSYEALEKLIISKGKYTSQNGLFPLLEREAV